MCKASMGETRVEEYGVSKDRVDETVEGDPYVIFVRIIIKIIRNIYQN
jgi:hypothetical protein